MKREELKNGLWKFRSMIEKCKSAEEYRVISRYGFLLISHFQKGNLIDREMASSLKVRIFKKAKRFGLPSKEIWEYRNSKVSL